MAYTSEPITQQSTDLPAGQAQAMREERMIDPHAHSTRMKASLSKSADTGQPNKVETAADPAKPAETVTLSPQVAALARKERQFRQQQIELKAAQLALEKDKSEIAQLRAMKEKLSAKDYSALDGLVDYNEYSEYQVNKLNGVDPNQEAIKKLSDEVTNLKKSQEENVSKLFEAAVSERRSAVKKLVETSPEFSSIKKLAQEETVVQHILDTWEHDSVELSVEEAAKEVQEELVSRAKRMATILEPAAPHADEKKPLPPLKPGIKTLTNTVTAGDANAPRKSLHHLPEAERWAEARRRAEAKLANRQG